MKYGRDGEGKWNILIKKERFGGFEANSMVILAKRDVLKYKF